MTSSIITRALLDACATVPPGINFGEGAVAIASAAAAKDEGSSIVVANAPACPTRTLLA